MLDEIWKAIPGHEGYEASDHGRVRSVDRYIEVVSKRAGLVRRRLKGRILTLSPLSNGYVAVALGRGGLNRMVHRLVASAFLPNPNDLPEVNHKNLRRSDNAVGNLEWSTSRNNKLHSYASGTRKQHAKTTPVALIGAGVRLTFESELAAAQHLGVSAGSVHSARNRNHLCCGYAVEAA